MSDEPPAQPPMFTRTTREMEEQTAKDRKRTKKILEAAEIAIPLVLKAARGHYIDWPKASAQIERILA